MKKLVIYLLIAQDRRNPLPSLSMEQEQIIDAFRSLILRGKIEVVTQASGNLEQFYRDLQTYHDRIALIHFAGHGNGEGLFFNGELSLTRGLAQALSFQKRLKLIFLNACATREQVRVFHNFGIPNVIATSSRIQDHLARQFASIFYWSFSMGQSISHSFQMAESRILMEQEYKIAIPSGMATRHISKGDIGQQRSSPWGLYPLKQQDIDTKLLSRRGWRSWWSLANIY